MSECGKFIEFPKLYPSYPTGASNVTDSLCTMLFVVSKEPFSLCWVSYAVESSDPYISPTLRHTYIVHVLIEALFFLQL